MHSMQVACSLEIVYMNDFIYILVSFLLTFSPIESNRKTLDFHLLFRQVMLVRKNLAFPETFSPSFRKVTHAHSEES